MDHNFGKVLVGGALVLCCGRVAGAAPGGAWAQSLFAEKSHDFGPVPRGAKVRHDFVLTNRLAEPITIVNIHASCGCTNGRARTALVPPGGSSVIEAEMDTKSFVGVKATVLYVTLMTASGREAETGLGVSANILSDIVLNPGTIDFGSVARGQAPRSVLTIDRIGAQTWKVDRMVTASRALDASLVETTRNAKSVGYTLTVGLKPGAPAGTLRDEIRLLTNDPETPSIPVLVTAQIRGELVASPTVLALGHITSAGGGQGRFIVRGTKPFTIRSVEGAGDGFHAYGDDTSAKPLHVITVTYKPEEGITRGDLRRVLRVVTDLPDEPPLELTATLHVDP